MQPEIAGIHSVHDFGLQLLAESKVTDLVNGHTHISGLGVLI